MSKRFFKAFYWIKLLSKFVSVQLIVQALNLASGILIIRTLSKEEYAYFTLANAMQGTINVLADSGISSALSAIGGRVWQDPYRFGQLINTAMQLRRYLAIIATLIITPILFWMLIQNGASIVYTFLLIAAILIELLFYLNIGVLRIVPRLRSEISLIQQLDLLSSGSRLVLIATGSLTILNAVTGAFASTITSCLNNLLLWRFVKVTVNTEAPTNEDYKKEIIKTVSYQMPNTIFYCFQGQITIYLISIFGKTENIAEIAALGRFGLVVSIISAVMQNILIPIFAKCQSSSKLIRLYFQIIFIYVVIAIVLLLFLLKFPNQLLWILGNKYINLNKELFWVILQNLVYTILGAMGSLNTSKAWIPHPFILISLAILSQCIALLFVDLSSIKGVSIFSIISAIPGFFLAAYITYKGIQSINNISLKEQT